MAELEEAPGDHLVQPPMLSAASARQVAQDQDCQQAAQDSIQSYLQEHRLHNVFGQLVPMFDQPNSKNAFISYV